MIDLSKLDTTDPQAVAAAINQSAGWQNEYQDNLALCNKMGPQKLLSEVGNLRDPAKDDELAKNFGYVFASNRIFEEGNKVKIMYQMRGGWSKDDNLDSGWRMYSGEDDEEVINSDLMGIYDIRTILKADDTIRPYLLSDGITDYEAENFFCTGWFWDDGQNGFLPFIYDYDKGNHNPDMIEVELSSRFFYRLHDFRYLNDKPRIARAVRSKGGRLRFYHQDDNIANVKMVSCTLLQAAEFDRRALQFITLYSGEGVIWNDKHHTFLPIRYLGDLKNPEGKSEEVWVLNAKAIDEELLKSYHNFRV